MWRLYCHNLLPIYPYFAASERYYENMPIQIYRKFHLQKLIFFLQIKNSDIFHICLLKTSIIGTR